MIWIFSSKNMRYFKFIIPFLFVIACAHLAVCQTEPVDKDEFMQIGNKFVRLMSDGDFAQAVIFYDVAMLNALPEDKLKLTWESVEQKVGVFKEIEKIDFDTAGEYYQINVLCRFESSSLNVRVVLDQEKKVTGLWFLPANQVQYSQPDYVNRNSFTETDITFGLSGWELPGTLSIPKGDGKYAAIVLVHGSGPNDRNESIGPNQPFKDLAWGLSSREIVVLRYDKRTKIHGKKMSMEQTNVENEVIVDALEAIQFLRQRSEVDSNRIFLLGHSLGAMLAPEIAARDGNLAGIILLAAPARPLEVVLLDQLRYLSSLKEGESEEESELELLKDQIHQISQQSIDPNEIVFGAPASYYYDLKKWDQLAFAQQLSIPMLILQGGRDYQVTMEDFQIWQEKLQNRDNVKFIDYPNLNHLFMAGEGMAIPGEYLQKKGNVAEEVIFDVVDWMRN